MTEREAINCFELIKCGLSLEKEVSEKMINLAIAALEKQIPKKPISSDCLLCRECCEEIRSYQWKLCPVCETRIDWSEEE